MANKPASPIDLRRQRVAAGRAKKTFRKPRNLLGDDDGNALPMQSAKTTLSHLPERVRKALEGYETIKLPVESWQDAKAQQQTVSEALANEARLVELEVQRGKLFDADDIMARDEEHDELFIGALNDLAQWFSSQVPVDQMNATRKAALVEVGRIRAVIAEKLNPKAGR